MSPASIRGTLVSLKEAAIVLGICLGYGVGYAYSEVEGGWRWAYGWTVPASVLLLVGAKSLPPSARWLALRGKNVEAVTSLAQIHPVGAFLRITQLQGDTGSTTVRPASTARSGEPWWLVGY